MTVTPLRTKNLQPKRREGAKPPRFTDEALALRFADRHAGALRYVAAWSKWLAWDGTRWWFDDTLDAFDRARRICREAAVECENERTASVLASAKTVAAVERLAKADRRLAATVEQWDSDPWLLNTPDCVVDLRTGKLRPHEPLDYLTKITGAAPDTSASCPTWRGFLDRITAGDDALQSLLQRVVGYALTGSTRDHALFFGYGNGANGKSVFVNTIAGVLGDYHRTAPIETFTASCVERHPTDLAGLRGARLVTAVETEEGRRWAESRIKALTGGDRISARFMRQDYFEFVPQFKLFIAGNRKPGLRSVNEAIRRRFHLISFAVTIPAMERDELLTERLKQEWPAILAWAVEGCLDWQRQGLAPPEAVRAATAAYLEAEDTLAAWIDESCERDPGAWERTSELFASFRAWAERCGEQPVSMKRFSDNLEARGFTRHRKSDGRGFSGLRLRPLAQVTSRHDGYDGTSGYHRSRARDADKQEKRHKRH